MSRFSRSEPSSSASPVCTKHPRQRPLCIRTTPQQCGHSSCSCGVAVRESVKPVRSIFHCPGWLLVANNAPFVRCLKAIRWPEPLSLPLASWAPDGTWDLARVRWPRKLSVMSGITWCTSTSTGTRGQSSPKPLTEREKGLVFTQLFQLRLSGLANCARYWYR